MPGTGPQPEGFLLPTSSCATSYKRCFKGLTTSSTFITSTMGFGHHSSESKDLRWLVMDILKILTMVLNSGPDVASGWLSKEAVGAKMGRGNKGKARLRTLRTLPVSSFLWVISANETTRPQRCRFWSSLGAKRSSQSFLQYAPSSSTCCNFANSSQSPSSSWNSQT